MEITKGKLLLVKEALEYAIANSNCESKDAEFAFLYADVVGAIEKEKQQANAVSGSIQRVGFAQAMKGNELIINTETDELVTIVVNDKETRCKFYCNKVKVTIELLPGESKRG